MFICLWVAYSCFHTKTADLSSCDRSLQILKYLLSFTERICLHGSQSCHGEGACVIQWSYEPCWAGPPKTDGHRTILTNLGPLEDEMAIHSSIIAWRTSWTVWKGKKIWHWKMGTPGWEVSNILLVKSGEKLLIAPERMKQLGWRGNDAQLWMCLEMKVKSNALKYNVV